jgi:HAMP domain-containing protein
MEALMMARAAVVVQICLLGAQVVIPEAIIPLVIIRAKDIRGKIQIMIL